jgi:hypothetical protein
VASVKNNGRVVRQALTAACAAAGLLLAACDASNNTTAAQKAGRDAAGRMMSAGEPRATDKLMTEVAAGDATALAQQLKDRVAKAGSIGDYVQQNASDKDLEAAIKQLQDALALIPSAATKAGLQVQLAAAQLQLADVRNIGVQADALSLNQQADDILTLAQEVIDLNNQAAVLEKSNPSASPAEADKAKAAVADRQKAVADAQAKVQDLQAQMTAKESQARKIYADTDAAFTAADTLKGKASIAAANKAMDDRKQAESLMAESGMLAPELAQSQADLKMAQVALDDAQRKANQASDAYVAATKASTDRAGRITNLRGAAASILAGNGKDDVGLTARLDKFVELAGKLDPQIRGAVTAADSAAGSFNAAGASYGSFITDLKKKADDQGLKSDDPLQSAIKDQRTPVLIIWSKSAAEQQAGRLCLTGAQTFGLVESVVAKAGQANLKAKSEISPEVRNYFAGEAPKKFQSAMASVDMGNQRKGGGLDLIKWIGLSLELTAREGAFLAGNRGALDEKIVTTLKTDAAKLNPNLAEQLNWIGQ